MFLYHILEELAKETKFNLYTYGLKLNFTNSQQIYTVAEMENIRNSLIIIDELSSLWDLDNRKSKKSVENSLRLINHNNNILVVCGTPENFKKFISAKLDVMMFKKTTMPDMINGSRLKNILTSYKGNEKGEEVLNLPINEALIYDGKHFSKLFIPYYAKYDSKKENVQIFVPKKVQKRKSVVKKRKI
jgi:hypothetical protein